MQFARGADGVWRLAARLAAWLVALIMISAFVHPRWGDPIEMQVTGPNAQPLAGVAVVASWGLKGGLEGGNSHGALVVREAITDESGYFRMPGWGPKIPTMRQLLAGSGLRDTQPELYFFKSGYRPVEMSNDGAAADSTYFVKRFSKNGARVVLQLHGGTPQQFHDELRRFAFSMEHLFDDEAPCAWRSIPKMIGAIQRENRAFQSLGIREPVLVGVLMSNEQAFSERGCGSAAQFLRHALE